MPNALYLRRSGRSFPPAVMQEMSGLVPGAALKLVDPGAHVCNIENPAGFNAIVRGWLSR